MKALLTAALMLISSHALADGCITNRLGKIVCNNGQKAVLIPSKLVS